MRAHTISSREFTRDVAAAKQASASGPVFITDRGTPAHVLLSIDDYRRLAGERPTLMEAMESLEASGGANLVVPERAFSGGSRIPGLDD
jgi:PHD/YefM family antitoxin component YafN of YafNO toxin-antitoxin module